MTAYRKRLLQTSAARHQQQTVAQMRERLGLGRARRNRPRVLGDRSEPLVEEIARQGAEQSVQDVLEAEVEGQLERHRHERKSRQEHRGYRNGHGPQRTIATRCGPLAVRRPKVRDSHGPVVSSVLPSYQRATSTVSDLLPDLYLAGLSTGDFRLVLQEYLGQGVALSPSQIVRLKAKWEDEYRDWCRRPLAPVYAYVWADGIYLRVGNRDDGRLALLVVMGVNETGRKEILAIEPGYRESTVNWQSVLRSLRDRGVEVIRLLIGDGIAGLWQAATAVYPETRHQRCWRHKIANVLGRLPVHRQQEALVDLRRIYNAPDRAAAEAGLARFACKYHDYGPAVDSLLRDSQNLLTYYEFPKAHRVSLKTTNPLESVFAPVRTRLNKTKRIPNTYSALSLAHQLLLNREARLRRLAAPNLTAYVAAGKPIPTGVTGRRWYPGRRQTA